MNAMKEGNYYATTGPEFHRIEYTKKSSSKNRNFIIECSPVEELVFIGPPAFGIIGAFPGVDVTVNKGKYIPGEKKIITSFEAAIPDSVPYIRCRIKDQYGKYAWTNPYWSN